MSDPVFDEEIALRRFQVAVKRADWRMFEQALERLDSEIDAGAPFSRHQAWQDFAHVANERAELKEELKERFRTALTRLLSVETRVAPAVTGAPGAVAAEGVAVVLGWQSGLRDARVRAAFAAWLGERYAPHGASAARQLLLRWLDEGVDLAAIAHRANLTLAAVGAGLGLADPPWVDTFYAGLARALDTLGAPPLTRLGEALEGVGPACVIVAEPGASWERHYAGPGFTVASEVTGSAGAELIKLAGSLDLFACPRCHQLARGTGTGPRALSLACSACGEPSWPLVLPMDQPAYVPPGARAAWDQAEERLRRADTWVLVEPPQPEGDAFSAWLVGCLSAGKRVLVVASERQLDVLDAWQTFLAPHAPRTVVTSRGPADEVLAFLLRGGVPELAQAESPPAAFAPKKKARR